MTHQQLLTPKVEVTENFDGNSESMSNNVTPESSRISTPDNVLNNNNNMSTPSTSANAMNAMSAPTNKVVKQKRIRRRATSQSHDPAEQLTEMSVRGLNLFRYASINEGIYQCTECAKMDVTKTFKNKYSFQRHAFLYHEGQQRKVFPCPVCGKEFSRPDKMKNHMKTVHDCFMPKDVVSDVIFPPVSMGFFPPSNAAEEYMDYSEENNQNHTNLPSSITVNVEVIPHKQETVIISTEEARNMLNLEQIKVEPIDPLDCNDKPEVTLLSLPMEPEVSAGIHFLTDEDSSKSEENYEKKKSEFLEYMPQEDGSVVCKRCGEVLASRTHWYRHKYKVHVINFGNPSPLFKCEHCNVFFKSRKGYMGHYSTRHAEMETAANTENIQIKEEPLEATIATISPITSNSTTTTIVRKRFSDKTVDWEEQRIKEEKLVADIINRVRRECEAQGAVVSRKGYSRRTTSVMNINSQAC